jgi:hypothetical protein
LNELGQAFNTLQNTLPLLEQGGVQAGHEALLVCFRALETAFTRCEARLKLLGGLTPREGGWLERLPVRVQEWTQALRTQNLLPEDMMRTLRHFSHHLARIAPGLERCLNLLPPAVATEPGGLPTGHDPLPALHAEMSAFLALLDAAHPAPERRAPIQLLKQFLQSLMPFPEQHENIQAALLTLDTVLPPLEGHDSPAENWPSRLPQRLYQLLKLGLSDAELHPILSAAQRLFPRLALLAGQLPLTARATPPELWLPAEFPAEALALPDAPLPDTPEALRVYLKACGLGEPSDARCSQLLRLAQGSRERLEALLLLTRAQMPLLPAHIQTMVEYVRLVPPGERFQSISQVLLYLSDALIARLKTEIQQQPSPATLTQLLKAQDWQPDETARPLCESLLRDTPTEPSPETFESLRYLLQSPLPKTTQNLEKLQLLTQMDWHPRQLLQKIQEPLAHLLALLQTSLWGQQPQALPMQRYLLHLQQYFQQVQQLLSPGQQIAPGPWLLSLSTRLQALETDFLAKLPEYEAALHDDSPPLPGLFRRVIRQVGRQAERLASEQPERREEIQQALARFQQETHHLQEKLSALQGFMAAEQSQESGARQLLLPVWFQALGYPAEISIRERPEGEPGQSGRQQTEIQLKIDTHTLGPLLFSLHLRADGLHLRLGVESARIRQWIQPYLEALAQKLGDLPWTIQTLQVWIMPQAHQGHNLITRQMYARYRRASIDAL